jgi:hypothetical protein
MTTNNDISQAISALIDRLNAAEDKLNVNPTAFNWTPAMCAIWPDGMRPTMSGLLAVWEAMQGAAVYGSGSEADGDEWIEWRGGKCPVDDYAKVALKFRRGEIDDTGAFAKYWHWGHIGSTGDIVAYRVLP